MLSRLRWVLSVFQLSIPPVSHSIGKNITKLGFGVCERCNNCTDPLPPLFGNRLNIPPGVFHPMNLDTEFARVPTRSRARCHNWDV